MDGVISPPERPAGGGGEAGAAAAPLVSTPTKTTFSLANVSSGAAAAPITDTTAATTTDHALDLDHLCLLAPSGSSTTSSASEVASTPIAIIPTTPSITSAGGQSLFSFTATHPLQMEQKDFSTSTTTRSSPSSIQQRRESAEKRGADGRAGVFMTQSEDATGEDHSLSYEDEEGGYSSPLEEQDDVEAVLPLTRASTSAAEFDPLSFPQIPPQSPWSTPQQQPQQHVWGMSYYSPSQVVSAVRVEEDDSAILDVLVPPQSSTSSLMPSTMETSSSGTRRRQGANSASRRRGGGTANDSSAAHAANATTTTPSSSSGLRRPRNNNNTDNSNSSSRTSSGGSNSGGAGNNNASSTLRASLDAGMASVRRWLRSHSFVAAASSSSLPSSSQGEASTPTGGGPRGRSVTWVFENSNNDTSSSIESEDFFLNAINGGGDETTTHRNHHQHHHNPHQQPQQHYHHPTILEEDEDEEARGGGSARQRALSEPDAGRIRDWLFHHNRLSYSSSTTRRRRRRYRTYNRTFSESEVVVGSGVVGRQLSSSAAAALHTQQQQQVGVVSAGEADLQPLPVDLISTDGGLDNIGAPDVSDSVVVEMTNIGSGVSSGGERMVVNNNNNNSASTNSEQRNRTSSPTNDRELRARIRWIRINRRFQVVITMVALLFSFLLFGILIGWIVLTSVYVTSFDQSCDLPLKPYFWLVTFQLILDVFRNDIMRFVFNWDANSNLRIPVRVIVYNVAYLLYAFLVLRMGINNVIVENDSTCRTTAPHLFQATLAFVSLSIAAWATIVFGYLLPFCIVAALLTYNGYNPSSSSFEDENGPTQPVFPAAYSTTGAPTGTVELLRVVVMENYPENYPLECCICMEEFNSFDVVVETRCKHIFHKQCCREWLRQARTCPVCRTDIPSSLEDLAINSATSPTSVSSQAQPPPSGSRIPIGPTGRPVVGLFRMFQNESFNGTGGGGGGGGGPGSRSASPVAAGATPGDSSHSHSLPAS